MVLNSKFDLSGKFLVVDGVMSKDLRWYYELHGMKFVENVMLIPTELCVRDGNNIVVNARCSLLNDYLKCSGHYYNKPLFCRRFTEYSVVGGRNKGSIVTPNCLFKYKKMLKEGKH